MKLIKVIFITLEIVSLLGVAILVFLTDLQGEDSTLAKIMIVGFAILAVVYQREQGKIDWEDKEKK